jgi:hypothetical protein
VNSKLPNRLRGRTPSERPDKTPNRGEWNISCMDCLAGVGHAWHSDGSENRSHLRKGR